MPLKNLLLFLFVTSVPALAQTAGPKHDAHLQSLDWLTRGTWTARAKAPDGKVTLVQSKIRWAATGTAVYFETAFDHKPQYYGMYAYDPIRKQIRFFYASATGQLTEGQAVPREKGFDQSFTIAGTKGEEHFRSTITRDGEDAYDFKVYRESGNQPVLTVHYERK
jgi:hypothetical protein